MKRKGQGRQKDTEIVFEPPNKRRRNWQFYLRGKNGYKWSHNAPNRRNK